MEITCDRKGIAPHVAFLDLLSFIDRQGGKDKMARTRGARKIRKFKCVLRSLKTKKG